jgi:regulator of replication initiation timing
MKNSAVEPVVAEVKIPKAEAIEKIAKHLVTVQARLDAAKTQLKTAVTGKYALNFQVNALKKELHHYKAQAARLKKEPRTEIVWSDKYGA